MLTKVIKYRKLIICVTIILGIAFYFTLKHFTGNHTDPADIHTTYTGLAHIKSSQVIDKDAVIKSLSGVQELVGLNGHVEKTYIYGDSLFKESGWLKDAIGHRSIDMTVNSYFKMGINLSDIDPSDVRVIGETLHIKLPRVELLSNSIPFDEILFQEKTGFLRAALTLEEKQSLYSEIQSLVEQNIVDDKTIEARATVDVREALKGLLEKIPNVKQVMFSRKMS